MNWDQLASAVYYWDGSLRDIFVFGTSREDWRKWTAFINANYPVEFKYYDSDLVEPAIDIDKVFAVWDELSDEYTSASISINGIIVNCFFSSEDELDNDIMPTEVRTIEDHQNLMRYLLGVSALLDKHVVITPEMTPNEVLLRVGDGQLHFLAYKAE